MKDNWLEQELKDKLDGYDSSMNLEQAWSALKEKRTPKDRKRFLVWIIFGSLISLTIGLVSLNYMNKSDLTKENTSATSGSVSADLNQELNKSKALDESKILNSKIIAEPLITSINNAQPSIKSNHSKNLTQNNSNSFSKIESSWGHEPTSTIDKVLKEKSSSENVVTHMRNSISKRKQVVTNIGNNNLAKVIELVRVFPLLNMVEKHPISLPLNVGKMEKVDCPSRANGQSHYISVSGGYGFRPKGRIMSVETPVDLVSAQVHYQGSLTRNFYFRTGVNFDQFTNRVESQGINSFTSPRADQVVLVYHYQDGSTEEVLEVADVDVTETFGYTLYNRYKFISIPAMLGMNFLVKKQSYFQAETGISASIASKYDVKYFDITAAEKFNQVENLGLKRSGILRGLYAIQWNYTNANLNALELFLRYQGSFQVNNISNNTAMNIERFKAQQLFVGVQYRL